MLPKRPLRSVFIGNPRYLSVYALGVGQAMGILGHWHRFVSIFDPVESVEKQVAEMQPDTIWTHMTLWPPAGALGMTSEGDKNPAAAERFTSLLAYWKRRGTAVYLHDGDPRDRETTLDVLGAYSIALVNRSVEAGHWSKLPALRWPYAAMVQKSIAEPRTEWSYALIFAGHMRDDNGGLYSERTKLVLDLQSALKNDMLIVSPGGGDVNNRMLTADVAASANSVLGFARPTVKGWIDTRCFQWPGAGGVLVHDDAGEFLTSDKHYLKYDRDNAVDSVLRCVERAKTDGPLIRQRAFQHIQQNHTWVQRVDSALAAFYGR